MNRTPAWLATTALACSCGAPEPTQMIVPHNTPVNLTTTHQDLAHPVWRMLSKPPGSEAVLKSNRTASGAKFVPDAVGDYEVVLTDPIEASAAEVEDYLIHATNDPPVLPELGPQQGAAYAPVRLGVPSARDPNGDPFTVTWSITAAPDGSDAAFMPYPSDPPGSQIQLLTSTPGSYTLEAIATDDLGAAASEPVSLEIFPGYQRLDVPEATYVAYSRKLDRLVLASLGRLDVVNLQTMQLETIALDGGVDQGTAQLSASSTRVTVKEGKTVEVFTLRPFEKIDTFTVAEFGGTGILIGDVYYYPGGSLHRFDLRSRTESTASGSAIQGLFYPPGSDHVYAPFGSGETTRWTIANDPATLDGQIESEAGVPVVMFDDGSHYIDRTGQLVAVSDKLVEDLRVTGSVPGRVAAGAQSPGHHTLCVELIGPDGQSSALRLLDDQSLEDLGPVTRPRFRGDDGDPTWPTYVFFRPGGDSLVLVAQVPALDQMGVALVPVH